LEAHREWLEDLGIEDRLMQKASRIIPRFQKLMGLSRARYRGEARNATHFLILATAWNLRLCLNPA